MNWPHALQNYTTSIMAADIRHMKWWGWGYEDVSFDDSNKPALWPYLKRELEIHEEERTPPVSFKKIQFLRKSQ